MDTLQLIFLLTLPLCLSAKAPYVPYESGFVYDDYPSTEAGSLYKSFYDAYHTQDLEETSYLIPPLIHFIWLGSQVPANAIEMINTWKEFHSGWIIKIWTDEDVEPFGLHNKEAFDRAVNLGQKSDIFRYEILYRFGGVYIDIDFECLQPFDCLHKSCEFYAGVTHENDHLYNGLIGAKPRHPIFKACIDHLTTSGERFDANLIMQETGPNYFANIFNTIAPCLEPGTIALLPPAIFYPVPHWLRDEMSEWLKQVFIRSESMCLHYWGCSWVPPDTSKNNTEDK